jgi:hypothetical protein
MHQVNLAVVGAIIVGSIQRVLHGAARALRATPASRNRVASIVLLVLAQLMARSLLVISSSHGSTNESRIITGHIPVVDAHTAAYFVPAYD